MLTVSELLSDLDVRLLTGESATDVPVRWVHISEIEDPTPWLSGGELLLTTGMQLDTAERQRAFVTRLADHHLAGLGFGTGFAHADVPPALVQAAAEREFPVFEVPYDVPFIALTEAAFTQLVNEQYAVLRRALAAHERLERVVLSERGLDALASTLSTQIGAAVLVCDARGKPLVSKEFRRALDPDAITQLQSELYSRRREARAFLPNHGDLADRALALPVAADGGGGGDLSRSGERTPEAWLVAIKDSGPLSDFDRLTLHQAVMIVALELLRGRAAGDTERRLAGDVLAGLAQGELTGTELVRRLEPFGIDQTVASIAVQRPDGWRGGPGAIEDALSAGLRDDGVRCLVASVDTFTYALVAGMEEEELFALARSVAARLTVLRTGSDYATASRTSEQGAEPLRVGVGRAVAAADARRSFHEARCAAQALALGVVGEPDRAIVNGSGGAHRNSLSPAGAVRVATYKELGSFQLLLSLQDDEALRLFCDSILGPIEAGDGHYGGELMRSLEAFIEENGQWERAAKRLYCHRHTLRYRIRRVEELTGRDLSSARDRIEFWLAIRGRELVA
jgi:PucR family transcriptional regulator, purine catabolism regulatory protein